MVRRITVLAAIVSAGLSVPIHSETRRAVLVGINNYNPDNLTKDRIRKTAKRVVVNRAPVKGDPNYWVFRDLHGAVADAELMKALLGNLGFTDFVVLEDQDATADAILSALQKNLVDDAQPGDVRVFYYAGHGNHMKNSASREVNGQDQTLVPADHWNNVPDIRDKEISRILWQAARKGVKVTFIADCSHTGSLSRGAWNNRGQARSTSGFRDGEIVDGENVVYHEPIVNDPAEIDPQNHRPVDPEALGVLTLGAAQSFEEALEVETDLGTHGAFTWALSQVLKNGREPMDRVFAGAVALMRGNALSQLPVMGGIGRSSKGIFGDDADPYAGLWVAVTKTASKDDVRINGGIALGLYPGTTLKSSSKPPVTLEIVSNNGLDISLAKIVGSGSVAPGQILWVDRVTGPLSVLKVYIPPPIPAAALTTTAGEIGKLQMDGAVDWVIDATVGRPSHVMSWDGAQWVLDANPPPGKPKARSQLLGADPSAAQVKQLLPAGAQFLFLIPPSVELAASIHLGYPNSSAVKPVSTPNGAQYWFHGRLDNGAIEYAWVLPESTEGSVRSLAGASSWQRPAAYTPLPLRSEWNVLPSDQLQVQTVGDRLTDFAMRLGRIYGWLTLQSPPGQGSFPYHLTFKNVATGEFRDVGDMKGGELYKLYLRADPNDVRSANLTRRWVYVFALDYFGKSSLIFPRLGSGNEGNFLPYAQKGETPKFDPLIPIGGDSKMDLEISEPFGVDTYFLLTTEDPITDPGVLDFDGVRTKGSTGGGDSLARVLDESEHKTDGDQGRQNQQGGVASPKGPSARWSIEHLTLRSVAGKQ